MWQKFFPSNSATRDHPFQVGVGRSEGGQVPPSGNYSRRAERGGIALFEYVLMVPANRIGVQNCTVPQLKVMQEVITMDVFAGFAVLYLYLEAPLKLDYLWAGLCLVGAAYFMFRTL